MASPSTILLGILTDPDVLRGLFIAEVADVHTVVPSRGVKQRPCGLPEAEPED